MKINLLENEVNDIRTNIIETLLRLYKQLYETKKELHLEHERFDLHYTLENGMWLTGCVDQVAVRDYFYNSVHLGENIKAYHHVPYTWLKSLIKREVNQ